VSGGDGEPTTTPPGERDYLPLRRYSLIGNCETAALVADDASIDWLCLPDFDGDPIFARLLDTRRGGFFALLDAASGRLPVPVGQRYQPETAILETELSLSSGSLVVTDFMPMVSGDASTPLLLRHIRATMGTPSFALQLRTSRDYGEAVAPLMTIAPSGEVAPGGAGLRVAVDAPQVDFHFPGVYTLPAGQAVICALWPASGGTMPRPQDCYTAELTQSRRFWANWVGACTYAGPFRETVIRSAITLKLLSYAPTGALLAAPTTSLPERIGGSRNWDYRYTWVRDGAFTAQAFLALGFRGEALAFSEWLGARERFDATEMRTMYTIRGRRDLPEYEATALEGYRGSRPVRVGNGAAEQTQLDIYGEWLDFIERLYRDESPPQWLRDLVIATVERVRAQWAEPDSGIWEVRSAPQHFVYSKVMCWVTIERGLALARRAGWPVDQAAWRETAEAIRASVLSHGVDPVTNAFRASYEVAAPDAANLMLALVGFLPPDDPRIVATTDAIMRELRDERGFVYRYRGLDDGVGGEEGTFLMCTCWLVENLALQGREAEARDLFARLQAHSGPTGLLSEMIDSATGELLGNFPQAFSHLGLIRAALALGSVP
jgi:GH15 family glucan-1,4-alpha-glucosidase